jgi:type II secretory pathway pseudopilin PulG
MMGRKRQRGSALLIVFVFAAVIAIMLYREMPIAVFEAHRQKEELLIDRGNEYKHAIRLYVRKVGTFPPSIEALENTNRMRFLRHKFDDPLTGKDDWRILHAGPGGMIVDSKVKTNNKLDANGKPVSGNSGSNSSTGFGQTSSFGQQSSSFGQSSSTGSSMFGNNSDNNSTTPEVTVAPVPQRAPAVAANGSSKTVASNDLPGDSLLPGSGVHSPEGAVAPADTVADASAPATGAPQNSGQDAQGIMRSMLNATPNPQTPQGQRPQSSNRMGSIMSGGIAGVASKASGHSIKLVNDQDNYSLWEFYYDMTKEANAAMAAAQNAGSRMGNNGVTNQPSNTFGPSSTFGPSNNSNSASGFSLSNDNSNSGPGATPARGMQPQNPQPFPNQ